MSEVVHTPQLRFPEFSGAWNTHSIGKIGTFFSGGTPASSNKDYYSGTIPFIGSGKISSESVKQHITQEALDSSSAKIVNEGDLLYALYGATSGAVALSKINGAINQAVLCIRTNENKFFLKTWLEKNKERILGTYLQGGQGNLSAQIVKSLKLNLPTKPEQQKIAAFLTVVDNKIEQLSKKQELLGEYKKGLMQQIFSQAIRFKADDGCDFPDWEEKKLGGMIDIVVDNRGKTPPVVKERNIPLIEVNAIGSKSIDYKKVSKFVTPETFKNWFRKYLNNGDILFSTVGQTAVCSIYFDSVKAAIAQNIVGLRFSSEDFKFMYYLLTERKNNHKFKRIEMGAVQPSVKVSQMIHIDFKIPSFPEQQKIANFLSSIDNKIEQVGKQLRESKQFKKALLQQMFV